MATMQTMFISFTIAMIISFALVFYRVEFVMICKNEKEILWNERMNYSLIRLFLFNNKISSYGLIPTWKKENKDLICEFFLVDDNKELPND
jgi:hypothetical protein